ncbi:putative alpha-13-mannosyltransferase MNN1 [Spathaspora sp. JA1]|nr:putative alpha-13-mannosyltransferase MNN1 [Spathaspora sp. JA1]
MITNDIRGLDKHSVIYNNIFFDHDVDSVFGNLDFNQRCELYFRNLFSHNHNWVFDPNRQLNDFESEEFKEYLKESEEKLTKAYEEIEAPRLSLRQFIQAEYLKKTEPTREQTMTDYLATTRIFNKCYVTNDNIDQIKKNQDFISQQRQVLLDKKASPFKNTKLENMIDSSSYGASKFEHRVYPWLSHAFPVYERWTGQIYDNPPNMKSLLKNDIQKSSKTINSRVSKTQSKFLNTFKNSCNGKGIVISIADKHVDDVVNLIRLLRALKNTLPIEIVFNGDLSPESKRRIIVAAREDILTLPKSFSKVAASFGPGYFDPKHNGLPRQEVWFVNINNVIINSYKSRFSGFANKLLATLFNSFEEFIAFAEVDDGNGNEFTEQQQEEEENKHDLKHDQTLLLLQQLSSAQAEGSDMYASNYDRIFKNHNLRSVISNLDFTQRCSLYFKNLFIQNHDWLLNPHVDLEVRYDGEEYKNFIQENEEEFKTEFNGILYAPKDKELYDKKYYEFIKKKFKDYKQPELDRKMVDMLATVRVFNQCYLTNDDPGETAKFTNDQKQFLSRVGNSDNFEEVKSEKLADFSTSESFEHRIYPWLSFEYPVYEHWSGATFYKPPNLKKVDIRGQTQGKRRNSKNQSGPKSQFLHELKSLSNGRGIVLTIPESHVDTTVNLIHLLRALHNKLPIQIVNCDDISLEVKRKLVAAARDDFVVLPKSFEKVAHNFPQDYLLKDGGLPKQELWFVNAHIYPWLTFEYPTYEHWTGVTIHEIPDMKSKTVQGYKGKPIQEKGFLKEFKSKLNGKGIVITLPDDQVDDVVSMIRLLRALKNKLPIQIVNFEALELATKQKIVMAARDDIENLPVSYDNVAEYLGDDYFNHAEGGLPKQEIWFVSIHNAIHKNYRGSFKKFGNKFLAMMFNSFEECMLVDADAAMLKSPEYFFNLKSYKETGALLFRDRTTGTTNKRMFFKKIGPSIIDSTIEKVYGDKELFWLGMALNGDENYHINEIAAAAVDWGSSEPENRLEVPPFEEDPIIKLFREELNHEKDLDFHTSIYNQIFKNHENWKLDPNLEFRIDYDFNEFLEFRSAHYDEFKQEFYANRGGRDVKELGGFIREKYNKVKELDHTQRIVEYLSTLRIFNKCYVTNDNRTQIETTKTFVNRQREKIHQFKPFIETQAERMSDFKSAGLKAFEHRVYPWISFEYPLYEHWSGATSFQPPNLKSSSKWRFWTTNSAASKERTSFLNEFKNKCNGKGIVLTMPDEHVDTVVNLIHLLRALKNTLPIQIVNFEPLSDETKRKLITAAQNEFISLPKSYEKVAEYLGEDYLKSGGLNKQEIWFVSVANAINVHYRDKFRRFANKFLATIFNSFEEFILIDDDTVLLKPPEFFFQIKKYQETGALMFRDRTSAYRRPQDCSFLQKVGPGSLDSIMFDIPVMSNYTLSRPFFNGLYHYIEAGLVVLNRNIHFNSILVTSQINFFSPITSKVYGDKELFFLGFVFNGDENYHVNNLEAAAVGQLTESQDRLGPDKKPLHSQELCSSHPGHINDEDEHTLLWINSGFANCHNSDLVDYTKEATRGTNTKGQHSKRFTDEITGDDLEVFDSTRSKRPKITEEVPQDDDEYQQGDEGEVDCRPCGTNQDNYDEENDQGGTFIQCDKCNTWQHAKCMGFNKNKSIPENYTCDQCSPELYNKTPAKGGEKKLSTPEKEVTSTPTPVEEVKPVPSIENLKDDTRVSTAKAFFNFFKRSFPPEDESSVTEKEVKATEWALEIEDIIFREFRGKLYTSEGRRILFLLKKYFMKDIMSGTIAFEDIVKKTPKEINQDIEKIEAQNKENIKNIILHENDTNEIIRRTHKGDIVKENENDDDRNDWIDSSITTKKVDHRIFSSEEEGTPPDFRKPSITASSIEQSTYNNLNPRIDDYDDDDDVEEDDDEEKVIVAENQNQGETTSSISENQALSPNSDAKSSESSDLEQVGEHPDEDALFPILTGGETRTDEIINPKVWQGTIEFPDFTSFEATGEFHTCTDYSVNHAKCQAICQDILDQKIYHVQGRLDRKVADSYLNKILSSRDLIFVEIKHAPLQEDQFNRLYQYLLLEDKVGVLSGKPWFVKDAYIMPVDFRDDNMPLYLKSHTRDMRIGLFATFVVKRDYQPSSRAVANDNITSTSARKPYNEGLSLQAIMNQLGGDNNTTYV